MDDEETFEEKIGEEEILEEVILEEVIIAKKLRSLEMRVAELEDKIKSITISDEDLRGLPQGRRPFGLFERHAVRVAVFSPRAPCSGLDSV